MKMRNIAVLLIALGLFNLSMLPAFSLQENTKKQTAKQQKEQMKLFQHQLKKRKYDDSYKYDYVNLEFWKSFNDENLDNYINLAIKNNYDLKIATLNVDEFYQNMKLQFANELPQGGLAFAPNYGKILKQNTGWNMALPVLINYEADIFLKNRDKTKSTKKLYEASQYDERAAYISIASSVGTVYLNLATLNDVIEYQENIVKLRKQIYEIMQESNKQGLISTSDVVKADKAYINGTTQLIDYKKNKIKLLNQLAVLIGESPDNIDKLKISKLSDIKFSKTVPEEISTEVITNRPDYLKSVKMLEKSGIDVRIAKKEFLPTFNISGLALFLTQNGGSGLFSSGNGIYNIAAAAMLPVLTGGSRIAGLRLRKIQYDKMLENYHKTNLTAIHEINDAMISVKRDSEKLSRHKKQLQLENQDFGFTKQRYEQGIISKLDLIQRQENLLNVNQLVTNTQGICYIDYIDLYKATGSML